MNNNLDSQYNSNNNLKENNIESLTKSKNNKLVSKTKKKMKISNISKNDQIINNSENQEEKNEQKKIVIQKNKTSKIETINDLLNKHIEKKLLPPIESEIENNQENQNLRKGDLLIDNSVSTPNININKYLKFQIEEKVKQIKELSLYQDDYKKTLIELLEKINTKIKNDADKLFSGDVKKEDKNENKIDKEKRIKQLKLLVEKKKEEVNLSKETNKKYKKKYENMQKEYNIPSTTKVENYQNKINEMKENNFSLHKMIKSYNHENYLKGKKLDLNAKIKDNNDIKIYSNEYITLMKEKYNQYIKLNSSRKLIKNIIEQYQYLIKILNKDENENYKNEGFNKGNKKENEQNCEKINGKNFIKKIKKLKIEEDINILKEDLSGNEENIYEKIVNDKTLILGNNKIKNRAESINKNKQNKINNRIKLPSISREINNKTKKLINSKSCNDIIGQNRIIISDNNINSEDLLFKDISYDKLSNYDYEKINIKKQKYFDLDIKLDKSIKDLSEFYDNKVKNINLLLESNSKKLSNIQQENELLKSKIADYKRIVELNNKEQKLLKQNLRYKKFELNNKEIDKENIILENKKEKFEINDINKNIDNKNKIKKEEYIDMLKEKYKVKNKKYQDDIKINFNDFETDF